MPRPVVPILRLPRKRSVTLSTVRVVRRDQVSVAADQQLGRVDAALVQPAQLGEQDRRVDDDTVADDRGALRARGFRKGGGAVRTSGRRRRPCGRRCCRPGSAPHSPRIHRAGRWPFPCPRHPTEHRAAQVRAQAYTPSGRGMSKVRGRAAPPEPSNRCPGIDEAPGAIAQGALAPKMLPEEGPRCRRHARIPRCTPRRGEPLLRGHRPGRRADRRRVRADREGRAERGRGRQDLPPGESGGVRPGPGRTGAGGGRW